MRVCGTLAVAVMVLLGMAVETATACARDGTDGPCHCAQRAVEQANKLWTPAALNLIGQSLNLAPRNDVQIVHVFNFDYSVNPDGMPIMDATIHVGDTVRWVWDSGSHDVHSVEGSPEVFASEFSDPSSPYTFEHTYTHLGTFWYYCTAHGFDNGDGTADVMAAFVTVTNLVPDVSWNLDADGNWSFGSNWGGGTAPNGIDHIARFTSGITAPRTITVDTPRTVGAMGFESAISYAVAGPGTITLDVSNGQASIGVSSGSHTITAPLVLNDDTTIAVNNIGSTLTISGSVTATGKNITKTGSGAVQLETIRAAGLSVAAGSVRIRAKGTPNTAAGSSIVTSLSIAADAQLDLTDNSMVIDYPGVAGAVLSDTRQNLAVGRIFSSAADAIHHLGYVDTGSELEIKFAYAGDANLDGQVDAIDLGALAAHWQQASVWVGGDLDYNGFVDIKDLYLLASSWQQGVGNPLPASSLATALASAGLPEIPLPEPGSIGLMSICLAGALLRRGLK